MTAVSGSADRKLYLGPRLRVLRRELGLNQTRMAEELGVSPSYLNHLERNQRPLTAQMLLRLAETYDIDLRDFVASAGDGGASDLHELFADPLVRDIGIPRHEVMEVAENYPSVTEAMIRVYRALVDLRNLPDRLDGATGEGAGAASPLDWLRDQVDARHNHLPALDQAAEALAATLGDNPDMLREGLVRRLANDHGIAVQVMADDVLAGAFRHYDMHRRRLMLAERLPPASRLFAIAGHYAAIQLADPIAEAVARAAPPDAQAAALARAAVTNYAAAAIVMPYQRFVATASATRHDLDRLAARFGCSYEQVAHRLTTLNRPGARGIPFFLFKIDPAGNVVKRYTGGGLPVARFGGGCARWGMHRAFRLPGETITAMVRTSDGGRFATFARAFRRVGGEGLVCIVMGCDASHAPAIAALDGYLGEPVPIGRACHLCDVAACPERAVPPVMRRLDLQPHRRAGTPYPFHAI